jgi:hypothetical protein
MYLCTTIADLRQAVWKGTRKWTQRTLDKAGERILNVHGDDDDEGDEDEAAKDGNTDDTAAASAESKKEQ